MSNLFVASNNSVILDTTFTDADTFFKVLGSGLHLNRAPHLKVKKIEWTNPTGDLEIQDRTSKVIFFRNAPAEDAEYLFDDGVWWRKGFKLTVLGGGKVTIYFY